MILVSVPMLRGREELIGLYKTLEAALIDTRALWPEDNCPLVVIRDDATRGLLAVLMRHSSDPALCLTCYPDATQEWHRCRYEVEGREIRSVVEPVAAVGKPLALVDDFAA